ncbi:MAG TPA: hypothetical protein VM734_28975 [Kofleriaceae bacterium]|nr:hypothetical protein [Kofleriaceae bacterium]
MTRLAFCSVATAGLVLAAGCTDDPQYVRAPMQTGIEVGIEGMDEFVASATISLPVALETPEDQMDRAARAAELGVDVPYVRLDDLSVSIEWTIKNLAGSEGEARIHLNGGNEYFYYVPLNFVVDPDEDEEPPPLAGDIPLRVPAGKTLSGTFREDQIREASLDLEQITRGAINPFAAMLTINEDDPGVMIPPAMVPQKDLGLLIRYDLTFEADRHMILEYQVRVRDHRGILHDELLFAPEGELTPFMPAEFVPAPPAE